MTDTNHTTTEKLYHVNSGSKNILFTTQTAHPHYLELELHFPYDGIKVDFFAENINFIEEGMKNNLLSMAENIVTTLKTVHQKFRELPENERQEILSNNTVTKKLRTVLMTDCIMYCEMYWGKTLVNSVSKKLLAYLQGKDERVLEYSEFEYPAIYKELFYRYSGCESINYYLPDVQTNYWYRKFENDEKTRFVTFKKLNCHYHNNSLPESKTDTVRYEEFVKKEDSRIPFFIGTQFGTTPKITSELKAALEGQKIAMLCKSQLSGFEKVLQICEVKDGEFMILDEYINTAATSIIDDTNKEASLGNEVFAPQEIIYRYIHEGRNYFVTKKDDYEARGFILTMLRPFRAVQWDYFSSEIMCEQERQQIMPELIRYLDKLYEMVDVNAKNWKRGFDKFKFSNIENSLEFNMNYYVEMLYAGMGNNPTIFPENLCGNWTKSFFKTVLKEILETGTFKYCTETQSFFAFEYIIRESNKTLIDITPYNEEERKDVFSKLTDNNKINLYAAMMQGYGSQFDRLVAHWIKIQ